MSGPRVRRSQDRVPRVVFLVYYNVVFAWGVTRTSSKPAPLKPEYQGLVIPDLPVDEMEEFCPTRRRSGASRFAPLAAPTSTEERLARIHEAATGFVYCVSVAGVTGARESLPPGAVDLLRRVRSGARVPVALGFGISTAEAAVEAASEADGVIVGSKLMQTRRGRRPRAGRGVARGSPGGSRRLIP